MTHFSLYYGHMTVNILLIESEPTLRGEITSVLTEAFLEVAVTTSYFEALLRLDDFKPDLVVLDEELPLIDGWEACYQLNRTFGIPVILLGDDSSGDVWIRAVQAGADFYLKMPCSGLELVARVKTILRRYEKDKIAHQV